MSYRSESGTLKESHYPGRLELYYDIGGQRKGECSMAQQEIESLSFVAGRGEKFCRGCLGNDLFSALDLGRLPIANELLHTVEGHIEKFPLHLRVCSDCGLGQVADVVTPERIFRDYRYLSSMSTTFLKHASDFVDKQVREGMFLQGDWVLEIASNDGYLLKNFKSSGIKVIGVEPAKNVAEMSRDQGIETISEFFSTQLADQLLRLYGHPKLIIANNVMAHVPDLIDFIKGLAVLCGPKTKVSIENPSLSNILVGMQFDTIYHEHYSYLSASSVNTMSKLYGLELFKVEQLKIHGGSNRYWLQKFASNNILESSVKNTIDNELKIGLFDAKEWISYSSRVSNVLTDLHEWLRIGAENNLRIYGYGAAAKASTVLNSISLEPNLVKAIADLSLEKQRRFMPPHGISIISPEELFLQEPTDIIIFPWNIKSEIANFLRLKLGDQVRIWCVIPQLHRVEVEEA
jgi:hypothetical protein